LVALTVETAPDPIETPLLVKGTVTVGVGIPPVSRSAVNVVLPPKTIGFELDESSVIVGAGPTVCVTELLDAAKLPCAAKEPPKTYVPTGSPVPLHVLEPETPPIRVTSPEVPFELV
jgi:hypothetical protein